MYVDDRPDDVLIEEAYQALRAPNIGAYAAFNSPGVVVQNALRIMSRLKDSVERLHRVTVALTLVLIGLAALAIIVAFIHR